MKNHHQNAVRYIVIPITSMPVLAAEFGHFDVISVNTTVWIALKDSALFCDDLGSFSSCTTDIAIRVLNLANESHAKLFKVALDL